MSKNKLCKPAKEDIMISNNVSDETTAVTELNKLWDLNLNYIFRSRQIISKKWPQSSCG